MKNKIISPRRFDFLRGIFAFFVVFPLVLHAASQSIDIGNGSEPQDLDPHIVTANTSGHILINLFEGLVGKDPETLKVVPGVAEKWKISADGKIYTFSLRKNATWSDGTPVTAKDFAYSWARFVKPETAAEYAALAEPIAETSVKDPHTFVVTLKRSTPYFLGLTSHWPFFPVPQSSITQHGPRWTRPGNLVSNGPFMLTGWETNKVITLKKNPLYWDSAKVKLEEARFHAVSKPETEELMFRTGKLHSVNEVPIEKIPMWEKDVSGAFHLSPFLGVYFYWFNVKKPPLDNVLVRRALVYAIDREKIVKYVTKAGQEQALAFTPPGCGGYTAKPAIPSGDKGIKEAKALLAKAGFPEGKGLPPIELLYNSNENIKKIAEATQAMWKENLGVPVSILNQEWKVMLDNQRLKNFSMVRAGWTADFNDPVTFLDMFVSGNPNNHAGWFNRKFDELMKKASSEMNEGKRRKLFAQAEAIIMEELPVLPLYYYKRVTLRSPRVKGWYNNVEDYHPLKEVYLEDEKG